MKLAVVNEALPVRLPRNDIDKAMIPQYFRCDIAVTVVDSLGNSFINATG